VAYVFTAFIALVYRLSTSKVKLSEVNSVIPGSDSVLKHKEKVRKLWNETRDSVRKTAFNWISKTIRCKAHKWALERWEIKIANTGLHLRQYGHFKFPHKQGFRKGANCYSRSFRPKI
jgi:hypothetical protein